MNNNNLAKPFSSFTQPNYGENYYAPPPMYQPDNNNTNDLGSFSNQTSEPPKSLYTPFQMDSDAEKGKQDFQAHTVDQAGMYVPIVPKIEERVKPMVDQKHACKNCFDCQMRYQIELEEKRRRDRECMEACDKGCEACLSIMMCLTVILECCTAASD